MSPSFVTIVTGLPRSGTSLMMQMLQAGGMPVLTDGQRGPDEDNPRGYFELEAVKRTKHDPSWLEDAAGKAVKVIHLLLPDLPPTHEYRVIVMRREMSEILASQRKMLDRHGKRGAGLSDEQLGKLYADQLTKVGGWMAGRPNVAVMELKYNALVAQPVPHAAAINEFLGDCLDASMIVAAVDPTLYRNR